MALAAHVVVTKRGHMLPKCVLRHIGRLRSEGHRGRHPGASGPAFAPAACHRTNVDDSKGTPNVTEALSHAGNAGIIIGLGTDQQDDPATAYANTIYQRTD